MNGLRKHLESPVGDSPRLVDTEGNSQLLSKVLISCKTLGNSSQPRRRPRAFCPSRQIVLMKPLDSRPLKLQLVFGSIEKKS